MKKNEKKAVIISNFDGEKKLILVRPQKGLVNEIENPHRILINLGKNKLCNIL